jgi:NADH-quinone oxidoreductase subunit E
MAVLSTEQRAEADRIVSRYPRGRERSAVMPLLYLVQSVEGRVSAEGLREVAGVLGVTTAEVEAVATFYSMIRVAPTGAHVIAVCTNLPCALRGAKDVYRAARDAAGIPPGEETSEDGVFTVHEEECLGVCEFAPSVQVDVASHDRVTPERAAELVAELRRGEVPEPSRGEALGDFKRASRSLAGLDPEETRA